MFLSLALLLLDSPGSIVRDFVQPYEVRSASGKWRASIDPTSRLGHGPCIVRVECNGELVWEKQIPFTLRESVLSDTGRLAGYGLSSGVPGGEFVVAILGADGAFVLDDRTKCYEHPDANRNPACHGPNGVVFDSARDRLTLRIGSTEHPRFSEQWWRYSLASGARLPTLDPLAGIEEREGLLRIKSVATLPGVPLTLVEWPRILFDDSRKTPGSSLFALLDDDGAPVWALELPHSVARRGSNESEARADALWTRSWVLGFPASGTFELLHGGGDSRVTYSVRPGATPQTWEVQELTRAAWDGDLGVLWPHRSAPQPEAGFAELELVDAVALEVERSEREYDSRIVAFEPQLSGALRFARCVKRGVFELGAVDEKGQLVRAQALTSTPEELGRGSWIPLVGERWLAVESDDVRDVTHAWIVDDETGSARPVEHFPIVDDVCVAAAADGGFVVLGVPSDASSRRPLLVRFDARAQVAWAAGGPAVRFDFDPEVFKVAPVEFDDGDDVAFGPDGVVYVLRSSPAAVLVFSATGELVARVALGETPDELEDEDAEYDFDERYFDELLVAPSGELLVHDSRGEVGASWIRFDAQGKELGQRSARAARPGADRFEASTFTLGARDELWTAFDDEILSYDALGRATTRYGAPLDPNVLHSLYALEFDERGHVIALDGFTFTLFVFGADGALVESLVESAEVPHSHPDWSWNIPRVCAGPDGGHMLGIGYKIDAWLELDASGKLVSPRELGGDLAQWRSDGGLWVADSDEGLLRRLARDRSVVSTVDRHPSGQFFEEIFALALGPDDGLALLARAGDAPPLVLYDRDGKHLRSLQAPFRGGDKLSWRGEWVIYRDTWAGWQLLSVRDGAALRLEPPVDPDELHAWGLSPDGREAWRVQSDPLRLRRFALPD